MSFWGYYVLIIVICQLLASVDYYSNTSYMYCFIIHLLSSFIIAFFRTICTSNFWWSVFIHTFFSTILTCYYITATLLPPLLHLFFGTTKSYTIHPLSNLAKRPWKHPTMFPSTWCMLSYIMILPSVYGLYNTSHSCDLRQIWHIPRFSSTTTSGVQQ
jgi:hypothetical protein